MKTKKSSVKTSWEKVAGQRFNEEYRESGPSKYDIEEMRTNAEYEACVVWCVVGAYEKWAKLNNQPCFSDLSGPEKIKTVETAINDGSYGWYRGNLPEPKAIRRALKS